MSASKKHATAHPVQSAKEMTNIRSTFDPALCRCCGSLTKFRVLNVTYWNDGQQEMYSDMIKKTFGIELCNMDGETTERLICAPCVNKLREAHSFWIQVETTENKLLLQHKGQSSSKLRDESGSKIKQENCEDSDTSMPDGFDDELDSDQLEEYYALGNGIEPHNTEDNASDEDYFATETTHSPTHVPHTATKDTHSNAVKKKTTYDIIIDNQNSLRNAAAIIKYSFACPFRNRFNHLLCHYCAEYFLDPAHLRAHTLTHSPKDFKPTKNRYTKIDITRIDCKLCSEHIDDLEDFKKHLSSVHCKQYFPESKDGIIPFKLVLNVNTCALCGEDFQQFKGLVRHMDQHFSNYVCETCGMGFMDEKSLQKHRPAHDGKRYPCSICGSSLKNEYTLQIHIKRLHEKSEQASEMSDSDAPPKEGGVPCQGCDQIFKSRKHLAIHVRKDHMNYRHTCQICGQKFFTRFALNNHMPTHTGERNFKCKECGKTYPRLKTLKEHTRIHTNDRRYSNQHLNHCDNLLQKDPQSKCNVNEASDILESSFEELYQDSGSEYISDTDENDEDFIINVQKKRKPKKSKVNSKASKLLQDQVLATTQHLDISFPELENAFYNKENYDVLTGYENEKKHDDISTNEESGILRIATKNPGKRTYDKKHACMYCKLLVSKLPRHLEAKHKNEIEVAQFMAKPLHSKERNQLIEDIRQKGNYIHNSEAITSGKGIIIPKRRPNNNELKDLKEFTPCGYCHGLFDKKYCYAHRKQCAMKHNLQHSNKSGKMTLPVSKEDASIGLQEDVLANMRKDDLYHVVRTDSLILRFGSELYKRLGNLQHLHVYIAQRMRQIARYVVTIRDINKEICNLSDSLHPKYYNDFVKAVKCLGKYEESTGIYAIPTLPLRLRTSIQQCAAIYKSDLIIKGQGEKRYLLDDFVTLIEMNYRNQVSSQALTSAYKQKWNKTEIIPLASDISVLSTFLKEKADKCMTQITQETDAEIWIRLCEVTLVQTLLFNRRRSGEVERMFLNTYENRDLCPINEEMTNTLTDVEKHIAKNLTRIEVRGKKGRKVPILLPKELKLQIDTLNSTRKAVGISDENPYLFPNINSSNHMRASDKLREMTERSGVKNPQSITSTKLRKHVATTAQLLNLKDNEMDSLATYMGHDIRVHREFYRLPDGVTQMTKVSKLLLAMDSNTMTKNKNKNVDTMEVYDDGLHINEELIESDTTEEVHDFENLNMVETTTMYKTNLRSNKGINDLQEDVSEPKQLKKSKKEKREIIKHKEVRETIKIVKQKGKKVQKEKRQFQRRTWTAEERDAMNRQMAVYWLRKKVPNKTECEECLNREPDLGRRSWRDIKTYVYNVIKKNAKILNV